MLLLPNEKYLLLLSLNLYVLLLVGMYQASRMKLSKTLPRYLNQQYKTHNLKEIEVLK